MKKAIIFTIILLSINILTAFGQQPKTAEEFYMRGMEYAVNGDNKRAEADFSKAIKLNPNHGLSYGERASLLALRGMKKAAIADFTMPIKIHPQIATTISAGANYISDNLIIRSPYRILQTLSALSQKRLSVI